MAQTTHAGRWAVAAGLAAAALALGGCGQRGDGRDTLRVAAAVSLSEALTEVGRAFTARGGPVVAFNFAASNVLARQIREGARMDVFVSADERQMDALAAEGLIQSGTRAAIVSNALVVMVREGWHGPMRSLSDLAAPGVRRIAVGDPAAVPAGVYARQALERSGTWPLVSGRLVPSLSARAALAAVEDGHVDAAIVYASDARVAGRARVAFTVSADHATPIVYPAAVVAASRRLDAARRFVEFLQADAAARVFAAHGFAAAPPR